MLSIDFDWAVYKNFKFYDYSNYKSYFIFKNCINNAIFKDKIYEFCDFIFIFTAKFIDYDSRITF